MLYRVGKSPTPNPTLNLADSVNKCKSEKTHLLMQPCYFKVVHPKMKMLSSFTQVVPNLYAFLCSAEHKGRYSEECGKQSSSGS